MGWVKKKFEKILRNVFSGVEKDEKVSAKSKGVGVKSGRFGVEYISICIYFKLELDIIV